MAQITIENCNAICIEAALVQNVEQMPSKAAAWEVVYDFCEQRGMIDTAHNGSPLANVIRFISNALHRPHKITADLDFETGNG